MTLTAKKTVLPLLILLAITTVSAEFYYNDGGGFGEENYFEAPELDSQGEIATELVAPFIFIAVLLHFGLSRALSFILAEDVENSNYQNIPWVIPIRERQGQKQTDASKYSLIMSLTITGSLVPTPYWGMIQNVMKLVAASSALAFLAVVLFVIYIIVKAISNYL